MWTDAHCHLDPEAFDGDAGVDAAVERATHAGVSELITIGAGYGVDGMLRAKLVANRHPRVWFTVGVHPHDAAAWSADVIDQITRLAADPKCVALGEMGLDFHYDYADRDIQRRCLMEQIGLAKQLNKPIVVHDRESDGETLDTLCKLNAFETGVLFHCFAGDVADMQRITALGGMISIPGIVTFKKAGHLREVAARVPEDQYMVETDSPFLAPMPYRGKRNEPAYVVKTGEMVASLRGEPIAQVARQSAENAARFFGLVSG